MLLNPNDPMYQQQVASAQSSGRVGQMQTPDKLQFISGNMYPGSQQDRTQYATPTQMPAGAQAVAIKSDYDSKVNPITGEPMASFAKGGIAALRFNGKDGSDIQAEEEKKAPTMAELAGQLKEAYRTNANYDDIWKQFAATQSSDPQQWYRHQLDFLGNQIGWQQGQNTGERAAALQPQIDATIADAQKAGLKKEEINSILGGSSQEANLANQKRIAEEAAQGKGWVNQNIPGGWGTVAGVAALAAAPYLAPELFSGTLATEGAWGLSPELAAELGLQGSTSGLSTSGVLGSQALESLGLNTAAAGAAGSGSWGLTPELAAELGLEGSSSGLSTSGELGSKALESMGLNTAAGGLSAKQAYAAKMAMDMLTKGTGEASQYASAPSYGSSAPSVMPNVSHGGATGYAGAASAPDYRSIAALMPSPYLSKISGVPGSYTFAQGGIANLGGYSDGGQLLRGPGDGMSDNIPASIGGKQPARLADGEFVVPADVVSHLGNGSTDAGAKQLYKMMDKIRKARTGTKKQGKQINPNKFLP